LEKSRTVSQDPPRVVALQEEEEEELAPSLVAQKFAPPASKSEKF